MYLLFDIGGTNMRVAVSSDKQTLAKSKIVPTPKEFEQGIQAFRQIAEELGKGEQINGIAGGIAGPIDKEKTMLVASPHIPGWVEKPLKPELEKAFGCKVIIENDTTMGGIGEAVKGAGVGYNVVAYIALGTGIGGKRIVNGKISEDSFNFEPGHQIIIPDGKPCNCGGKGHLEAYVGGLYIEKNYGLKGEKIKDPKIWDEIAKYLAIGLNNTIVHWSPDIVVLGGSIMQSISIDLVRKYLHEYLTIYPEKPKLALATLGHRAGYYGALELLK